MCMAEIGERCKVFLFLVPAPVDPFFGRVFLSLSHGSPSLVTGPQDQHPWGTHHLGPHPHLPKQKLTCGSQQSVSTSPPGDAAAAAAKLLQSCPTLATPWTAAHQVPPSLGFSRQEHWSGLPFPSPMHESEK